MLPHLDIFFLSSFESRLLPGHALCPFSVGIWGGPRGPGHIKPFCQEKPEPFHLEFLLLIAHDLAKPLDSASPFPKWIKIDKVLTSQSLQLHTIQTDTDQTWPRQTHFEKLQELNCLCGLGGCEGWTHFWLGRVGSLFRKTGTGGELAPPPSFSLSLYRALSILFPTWPST